MMLKAETVSFDVCKIISVMELKLYEGIFEGRMNQKEEMEVKEKRKI